MFVFQSMKKRRRNAALPIPQSTQLKSIPSILSFLNWWIDWLLLLIAPFTYRAIAWSGVAFINSIGGLLSFISLIIKEIHSINPFHSIDFTSLSLPLGLTRSLLLSLLPFVFFGRSHWRCCAHNPPKDKARRAAGLHSPSQCKQSAINFNDCCLPWCRTARQFSFLSSARPLGRASWKKKRNWMSKRPVSTSPN